MGITVVYVCVCVNRTLCSIPAGCGWSTWPAMNVVVVYVCVGELNPLLRPLEVVGALLAQL